MVREVGVGAVRDAVARLYAEACYRLSDDMLAALEAARRREASPVGREVLRQLLANARLAADGEAPTCQDTGTVVVFLELGQDVRLVGGALEDAVNEGVARACRDARLRPSIVADPLFERRNTGDNTPAVLHVRLVPGDRVRITLDAKGAGSENMSRLAMLRPADGVEGVRRFVLETVERAGPNACPPGIVGVGVGGTFETVALLAKRALTRPIGAPNADPRWAALERELVDGCNALGLGPQGLGGTQTVLAVHVEVAPTHIASLPVAVNIDCHAHRVGRAEL
jgi:fumarate hydratase subunit alpha